MHRTSVYLEILLSIPQIFNTGCWHQIGADSTDKGLNIVCGISKQIVKQAIEKIMDNSTLLCFLLLIRFESSDT